MLRSKLMGSKLKGKFQEQTTEAILLVLAGFFLVFQAGILSLSPAVRERSWAVGYRWDHWLAVLLWMLFAYIAHKQAGRWLPRRDPYLLPVAALLSGWGILTIWRLYPSFGMRQSLWLCLSFAILVFGFRLDSGLAFFRRYKYIWLTGSLGLTALTLVLGTNPMGYGPRMWLGCCGVYLQPSEPLKLLFIAYLAAYMADRRPLFLLSSQSMSSSDGPVSERVKTQQPLMPLLAPTLIMIGLALVLLVVQRDLGTASIFFFVYAAVVYVTTGNKRLLITAVLAVIAAGLAGYLLFDVVRLRVDAWLNPWLDPSGGSFQVIQALIAIANGGLPGRGAGIGNPGLVPVTHSDLIFTAIVEEQGLVGAIGLLVAVAILAGRGLRAALRAPDAYRSYLAAGVTAYLVGQSLLIIHGSLRLMPLTGIPLPFVSYGGSSLLTCFLSLLLLMQVSSESKPHPSASILPITYLHLGWFLFAGLVAAALMTGWWAVVQAPELLARTDNPRRAISDRFVRRGALLDRHDNAINFTEGQIGSYSRVYQVPSLGNVVGYTEATYGQSGLEASLDDYLRGERGNPPLSIWWNRLLFGQPPPGLNIRLSLDLQLQSVAETYLNGFRGAVVMLDSLSGDVLVMASAPGFDPNELDAEWQDLITDENAPLLNRAVQGRYPPGASLGPLLLVQAAEMGELPPLPVEGMYWLEDQKLECTAEPFTVLDGWSSRIAAGCPAAVASLGEEIGIETVYALYRSLGLFDPPQVRLPIADPSIDLSVRDPAELALGKGMQVSPLQIALAASTLNSAGRRPAANLALAVEAPDGEWLSITNQGASQKIFSVTAAESVLYRLKFSDSGMWGTLAIIPTGDNQDITWFVGGTGLDWGGEPVTVVVILETNDPSRAAFIAQTLIESTQ